MPRRAPTFSALLQKYLLVHEPNIRRAPYGRGDIGGWGLLERVAIRPDRGRISQILIEGRGRIVLARIVRGHRTRMLETPIECSLREAERFGVERMLDKHDTVVAKLFFLRIGNQARHFLSTQSSASRLKLQTEIHELRLKKFSPFRSQEVSDSRPPVGANARP